MTRHEWKKDSGRNIRYLLSGFFRTANNPFFLLEKKEGKENSNSGWVFFLSWPSHTH